MSVKSVLFVCMGNICRSPAAAAVFRRVVAHRGFADRFRIESAGTIGYHEGDLADPRMRYAAAKRGYTLDSRARQVRPEDFERFDLIVAMDRENFQDLELMDPGPHCRHKIRLLCDFIPDCPYRDVPDPFYGIDADFEKVLDIVERAANGLLAFLLQDDTQPEVRPPESKRKVGP